MGKKIKHKFIARRIYSEPVVFQVANTSRKIKQQNQENPSFKQAQPAITCSKLTIETLEQGVKYIQS